MNLLSYFRKRRHGRKEPEPEPQPLRIEGIPPAPLTPEPDDAELAAQALLEMMIQRPAPSPSLRGRGKATGRRDGGNRNTTKGGKAHSDAEATTPLHNREGQGDGSPIHDAAYYRQLADRIRQAHEAARQRTVRFVAFCEQELQKASLPLHGPGSLGLLNAELYKRIDIIDRYGGELKRRWQHCLAEVTVRIMQANGEVTTDDTDKK